ncbi:MAG: hypothetical protein ABIF77_04835, partial [bacterium]
MLAICIAYLAGCVAETDLGGVAIPNSLPDTYLSCDHPSTLEAGFLIRAQWEGFDTDGVVDPTPAQISFTATTLLPRIHIDRPAYLSDYQDAKAVPPTITFGYTGHDADAANKSPTHIRYLLKTTWLDDHYVRTEYEFNHVMDELVSFEDYAWSDWEVYPESAADRAVVFSHLPARDQQGDMIIYMFAIQARDTADAKSIERNYSRSVHNFYISNLMRPVIEIQESHLGHQSASGQNGNCSHEIAPSQELFFNWIGTAEHYANDIIGYRYGWDVQDPNDTARRQLLLVDDVADKLSHGWRAIDGEPLDVDHLRDFFWNSTLDGPGGVLGWSPEVDVIDAEEDDFTFRDIS